MKESELYEKIKKEIYDKFFEEIESNKKTFKIAIILSASIIALGVVTLLAVLLLLLR